MSKIEKKPGGDKTISRLRDAGDVLEGTVFGLLSITAVLILSTIGIRLCTDTKVYINKRKMKGR